jgi:hypothetical protein
VFETTHFGRRTQSTTSRRIQFAPLQPVEVQPVEVPPVEVQPVEVPSVEVQPQSVSGTVVPTLQACAGEF